MKRYYSSPSSRVPSHWGKKTWDALFLLASDFPHDKECEEDDEYSPEMVTKRRESWRQLLTSLPGVLTCSACASHFEEYLKLEGGEKLDRALTDRRSLFEWMYECKDRINRQRRRRSPRLSKVRDMYIARCERRSARKKSGSY